MGNIDLKIGSRGEQVKAWQRFVGAPADGVFGDTTERATKNFQIEANLRVDGRVGPTTLRAAERMGFVMPGAFVELPRSGAGFVTYNRDGDDQFGTSGTIEFVEALCAKWAEIEPEGAPVQVGDISRKNGGAFPPHRTHRDGCDVDFRPFSLKGALAPVAWQHEGYDRAATERFIRLIRRMHPRAVVLFNDPVLIRKSLCRASAGHDNHLHLIL